MDGNIELIAPKVIVWLRQTESGSRAFELGAATAAGVTDSALWTTLIHSYPCSPTQNAIFKWYCADREEFLHFCNEIPPLDTAYCYDAKCGTLPVVASIRSWQTREACEQHNSLRQNMTGRNHGDVCLICFRWLGATKQVCNRQQRTCHCRKECRRAFVEVSRSIR
jgi:hypothetical protein